MSDCLFCLIAAGEIESETVYEDADIIAFKDIDPQAPIHLLIVPKQHIATVNQVNGSEEANLVGKLFLVAAQIAREEEFAETGYRLVINCGRDGGQEVNHLHLHLLAGRGMGWPPG